MEPSRLKSPSRLASSPGYQSGGVFFDGGRGTDGNANNATRSGNQVGRLREEQRNHRARDWTA